MADKKTPIDWELPNCDFLSVNKQKELDYRIAKLLLWNHYCRKNIGYLYAIEHGAKLIFDTDDDNIIMGDELDYLPKMTQTLVYNADKLIVNPYAHFGQATIWPRGYPIEKILQRQSTDFLLRDVNPLIQQRVVNGDPDVDAIFRLTRGGKVFFNAEARPISLPSGTICPYNSQSTMDHYDAFWGLLISMATKFRVCDIWRGYWVQRMLWDIGGNLCFLPPNVLQNRNEHNILADFVDEIDLYCRAGELVNFLINWKSDKENLFDRIIALTRAMVEQGYYVKDEIELINRTPPLTMSVVGCGGEGPTQI